MSLALEIHPEFKNFSLGRASIRTHLFATATQPDSRLLVPAMPQSEGLMCNANQIMSFLLCPPKTLKQLLVPPLAPTGKTKPTSNPLLPPKGTPLTASSRSKLWRHSLSRCGFSVFQIFSKVGNFKTQN